MHFLPWPAALCALVLSQTAPVAEPSLSARIDAHIAASQANGIVPGAVWVSRNGEVLYEGYHGEAERSTGRAINEDTIFDIGSLTKQFTAAAVLKLVEDGALSLDATLADFFPDVPADKRTITLHQLLTHSSGFSDANGGFPGRDADPYVSGEDFLRPLWASALNRAPGSGYEYSNAGYTVLALVIEDVTGQTYESVLRNLFFEPLGLTHTGYRQLDWSPHQAAYGYDTRRADPVRHSPGLFYLERWQSEAVSYRLRGNGGLHSTPADMRRWMEGLWSGEVLSERSLDLLQAAHTPLDVQSPPVFTHYGYGWLVGTRPTGAAWITHAGSNGHFLTTVHYGPSDGLLILHMTNTMGGTVGRLGYDIADMIDDIDHTPAPLSGNALTLTLHFTDRNDPSQVEDLPDYVAARLPRGIDAPWILNRAGFHRLENADFAWALALLELNTRLFPGDGNLHDSLAIGYARAGMEDQARESFERALALDPGDGSCHWCESARTGLAALSGRAG